MCKNFKNVSIVLKAMLRRKPSHASAKLAVSIGKDEWDTKEDTGKSMKNALYILRYAKRHLSGRSDVKQ